MNKGENLGSSLKLTHACSVSSTSSSLSLFFNYLTSIISVISVIYFADLIFNFHNLSLLDTTE